VIAEICVRLDGLPLALELAAARVRSLPPQTLLSRLDQRLKLLTGGAQDLDERQRTLRATIEWSYDLLRQADKALFAHLGVFVGGCRLDAAEAVCDADDELGIDLLDGLTSLVENNLVRLGEEADGDPRYWMLETIREFAHERLAELPIASVLRRKHAEYFRSFAVDADAKRHTGWLDHLEGEGPNFHAALTWSARNDRTLQAHLTNALAAFWGHRGYLRTGLGWLEQVLEEGDRTANELRTRTLRQASYFNAVLGHWDRMQVLGQEWLTASQQLGDRAGAVRALVRIGTAHASKGEIQEARRILEQGLSLGRELQDPELIARALGALGYATHEEGDFAAAAALFDEALALEYPLGNRFNLAVALKDLGFARLDNGQRTEAAEPLRESLVIFHQLKARFEISFVLEALAAVVEAENPQSAVQLLGKADQLRQQTNAQLPSTDQARLGKVTASTKSQLDVTQWDRAWSEGRQLSLGEAVGKALEEESTSALRPIPESR
jgi:tetratricopeptide (TPR) repeat protein